MLFSLFKRNKEVPYPPDELIFIGGGDFKKIGDAFLQYFIDIGGLKPNHNVLDVGCGIGRMAIPMTQYLSKKGRYEGFDIVRKGIEWCTENITSRYPNFRFQHLDVYNKAYNPTAKMMPSELRFPYKDNYFDFVYLCSVFTHMLPFDVERYISEIHRVMKSGGRCFATFFLLNDESERNVELGKSELKFKPSDDVYSTVNEERPEEAVAYKESFIDSISEKYKLKIDSKYYGYWSGKHGFEFQDIVIFQK